MSESNSYREYFSPTGNINPVGFLENTVEFSIFPIRKFFLSWEILYSYRILNLKSKYITCQVRHTHKHTYKRGFILSGQKSVIWYNYEFYETAS